MGFFPKTIELLLFPSLNYEDIIRFQRGCFVGNVNHHFYSEERLDLLLVYEYISKREEKITLRAE